MNNLVVIHIRHALDLLGLLGDQLLQVLYLVLQVCGLNLTHLELLVSLMQLGLEVVDVALGGSQLILSMLQSGAGVVKEVGLEVKEVGLEVTVVTNPHQLVIQFLDTRLKAGILLEKLSVTLLNVLDGTVLGLHLADVLL
jgi:hypothetical protein